MTEEEQVRVIKRLRIGQLFIITSLGEMEDGDYVWKRVERGHTLAFLNGALAPKKSHIYANREDDVFSVEHDVVPIPLEKCAPLLMALSLMPERAETLIARAAGLEEPEDV